MLTSTLESSPRSAVATGSTEVGLPYSGSPGAEMLYSNALAGTARAAVRYSRDKSMVSFFIIVLPPSLDEVERPASKQHRRDNGHNRQDAVLLSGLGLLPGGISLVDGGVGVGNIFRG